jgi:hypothetical protein
VISGGVVRALKGRPPGRKNAKKQDLKNSLLIDSGFEEENFKVVIAIKFYKYNKLILFPALNSF